MKDTLFRMPERTIITAEMRSAMKTCYITFHSVSDSLKFEKAVQQEALDVKLVPVPREISSSCGVAAMFPPEIRKDVEAFLARAPFTVEQIHELERSPGRKSLLDQLKKNRKP